MGGAWGLARRGGRRATTRAADAPNVEVSMNRRRTIHWCLPALVVAPLLTACESEVSTTGVGGSSSTQTVSVGATTSSKSSTTTTTNSSTTGSGRSSCVLDASAVDGCTLAP